MHYCSDQVLRSSNCILCTYFGYPTMNRLVCHRDIMLFVLISNVHGRSGVVESFLRY